MHKQPVLHGSQLNCSRLAIERGVAMSEDQAKHVYNRDDGAQIRQPLTRHEAY